MDVFSLESGGKRLFGPEELVDPYPLYHRLRSHSPVYWSDELNGWLITGYDAVNALARHPAVSIRGKFDLTRERIRDLRTQALLLPLAGNILSTDPPVHTRLRSLVNKSFTAAAVERMRSRVEYLVNQCLGRVQDQGHMDIIGDLAIPLPIRLIVDMLGVPAADADRLREWSGAVSVLNNWVGAITEEQIQALGRAITEFNAYLRPLIEERRARPRDDLLGALVQASEAGDRLLDSEIFGNTLLLLGTGHETTTNLIGNGTLALLRHPDQWRKLCEDPTLIPGAVEELARYDCSVQISVRKAAAEIEIAGASIRKDQLIYLLWGAANRDPVQFPDPDRLDITRPANKHVAFGAGVHYCLGASLARLEGQITFAELTRRFPNMRPATSDLEYRGNFNLRGLRSLPVSF
jgi:cytochrome P450